MGIIFNPPLDKYNREMTSEMSPEASSLSTLSVVSPVSSLSSSPQAHVTRKLLFKSKGGDSEICCSVEDVDIECKDVQEETGDGTEENYEESAKQIKVIETDFKRPLRSSFRAKKGEKRISAVLFDSDPVLLSVPTTVNVQETANDRDDMEKNNKTDENYKSLETDINELTEQDFVKLNFGLRSRIRRDSLDKSPLKCDKNP